MVLSMPFTARVNVSVVGLEQVGVPPAIVNAVVDAVWHLGVRHIDIPITPAKVWKLLREHGVTE